MNYLTYLPPPHISIAVALIVPIYNVETYIATCLESLIAQQLENILIICVNDGSTDNSVAIVEDYQKKDPRIHIVHQENQGLGPARNTGMQYAFQFNPEYIGFVDSDDFVDSTMYKKLYTQALHDNTQVVYCDVKCYNNETQEETFWHYPQKYTDSLDLQEYTGSLFDIKITTVWDSIYATSLIKEYNIRFPNSIHEDTLWFIAIFTSATKVSHVREALYIYRVNRKGSIMNTITTSNPKEKLEALLRNYLDCTQWIFSHQCAQRHYPHICSFIINSLTDYLTSRSSTDRQICFDYIKQHFPLPIYNKIYTRFHRKKNHTYIQKLFSVTKDSRRQRKIITICGIQFRFALRRKSI